MRKRLAVFDRRGGPLFDLDLSMMDGEGAVRRERINGEHSLDVTTTQRLEEGMRILSRDGTGRWREWVVDEPCETHESYAMVGTYGCTWSMQYDLATVDGGELWPGTYEPIAAATALAMVLGTQTAWEVGTVTVGGTAGTSLYDGSVWEYLGRLIEVWGGEMEPRIVVGSDGVTHRYVDWLAHVGNEVPTRRFDYGHDCTRIVRKVAPGPRYCRVVPRGGRDATDADGVSYSERVGVEEEPYSSGDGWVHDAGSKWVRDPDAELDFRVPDGNGGWRYPEKVVIYDSDDPEELLELAAAEVHDHTRPKPTYEGDVSQFEEAGLDPHGVQLGDEVQMVDRTFGDAPLRLQGRVVEWTVNEIDEGDMQLVIGEARQGIESALHSMMSAIDTVSGIVSGIEGDSTVVHVQDLLDAINAEINATGGYTYLIDGEGTVTYDIEVDDPLVGYNSSTQTWASRVTQMKGGTLRFANTKKPAFAGIGDWNWTNVITADGYLALAATIARLTAGYIGSATSGNYWNLDTGEFRMAAANVSVGSQTLAQYIGDNLGLDQAKVFGLLTNNGALQGLYMSGGNLYINASYIQAGNLLANLITSGKIQSANGKVYFDLDNNEIACNKMISTATSNNIVAQIGSVQTSSGDNYYTYTGMLAYVSGYSEGAIVLAPASSSSDNPEISSSMGKLRIRARTQQGGGTRNYGYAGLSITKDGYLCLYGQNSSMSDSTASGSSSSYLGRIVCNPRYTGSGTSYQSDGDIHFYGWIKAGNADFSSIQVSGAKNRVVDTDSYGRRLLSCYETSAPLFGDVGSAATDEHGVCVVSIDDVFCETARTDMAYQVFLQPCGRGGLWVSEKHPTHFVVEGTPSLSFDWQLMAHQAGFEATRLEDSDVSRELETMGVADMWPEEAYAEDDLSYIRQIESLYEEW